MTVVKRRGYAGSVELDPGEGSMTYADLGAWLILSHLASQPIRALNLEHGEIVGLMEPAILGLVGTSPIPLRRVPDNLERSGLHTHDGPNGASLTYRDDGIVEPVTFSILLFLERQQENSDDWLQEACDEKSAPLLNRISQALYGFGFLADDVLLFGKESAGVPPAVADACDAQVRLPMRREVRSMNLATAAALALGEALRQTWALPG